MQLKKQKQKDLTSSFFRNSVSRDIPLLICSIASTLLKNAISLLHEIAEECKGITAIVGSPTLNKNPEGKKLFNSALVLSEGKVIFSANKALLPTYDIFDEYRYFEPEKRFSVFSFKGLRLAITICEDLWDEQPFDNEFEKARLYTVSPMEELCKTKS